MLFERDLDMYTDDKVRSTAIASIPDEDLRRLWPMG